MLKRPNIHRHPQDESRLAKSIVDLITTEGKSGPKEKSEKNPAAVALRRLRGSKGEKARTGKFVKGEASK
jgi:hypothetical protein